MRVLSALHPHQQLVISLHGFCLSDGYKMVSYCGLNFINVILIFLYVYWPYIFSSIELPIQASSELLYFHGEFFLFSRLCLFIFIVVFYLKYIFMK